MKSMLSLIKGEKIDVNNGGITPQNASVLCTLFHVPDHKDLLYDFRGMRHFLCSYEVDSFDHQKSQITTALL